MAVIEISDFRFQILVNRPLSGVDGIECDGAPDEREGGEAQWRHGFVVEKPADEKLDGGSDELEDAESGEGDGAGGVAEKEEGKNSGRADGYEQQECESGLLGG